MESVNPSADDLTIHNPSDELLSTAFLDIENIQCEELSALLFADPVCYVYNPLQYAKSTHEDYVTRYCQTTKMVLYLGMNPGPFGMAQNGVPFGEAKTVKDWLKIKGEVFKPLKEHPNRPIYGLECPRSEVSGRRFWNFVQEHSKDPETFFRQNFVHNYCPLAFLSKSGKNITPPDLKSEIRKTLVAICDKALCQIVKLLKVHLVIGVGKFAANRAQLALKEGGLNDVQIGTIMHPSPINPMANKGWDKIVQNQLTELKALQYLNFEYSNKTQ